jgi:hypothetical protein
MTVGAPRWACAQSSVQTLEPITVQGSQGGDYGFYAFDGGNFNWVPDEDWSDPGGTGGPAPESTEACDELNQRLEDLDCENKPGLGTNGCGSADGGWLNSFIPNSPPGANFVSFEAACVVHDQCYGALGSTRLTCDDNFATGMRQECENSRLQMQTLCEMVFEDQYHIEQCIGERMNLCIGVAYGYRTAVGLGGFSPFVNAQQGAACRDVKRLKQRAGCP